MVIIFFIALSNGNFTLKGQALLLILLIENLKEFLLMIRVINAALGSIPAQSLTLKPTATSVIAFATLHHDSTRL
jgi:hypothetical protein